MARAPKIGSTENGRPILGLGAISWFHYIMIFFTNFFFWTNQYCRMALKSEQLYVVFFFLIPLPCFFLSFFLPSESYCTSYLDCETVDSYCMVIGSHLRSYCVKFWEEKLDWRSSKRTRQFLVFNPQDPQDPRASQAKLREEEGFLGLVPLVTHPSFISLLGGLTPKFLSLSFLSL
jgi:hypothetical protein